ncbi:hypothetical protein LCGC14_2826970, partial [marine sediment metagenome]
LEFKLCEAKNKNNDCEEFELKFWRRVLLDFTETE